jgi:Scaffold protein Nfu/NifU N terminal
MGQPVAVTESPSSTRGQVRFELNRSLTGMGHEHYSSPEQAAGDRPADVLARRLFETDQVDSVHVYSNIVTVELARNGNPAPLGDVVRTLYRYWQPGMQPPAFEDLVAPDEQPAAAAAPAGEGGAEAALSAAAQRVPAHLLERARAGRERWKAKAGG